MPPFYPPFGVGGDSVMPPGGVPQQFFGGGPPQQFGPRGPIGRGGGGSNINSEGRSGQHARAEGQPWTEDPPHYVFPGK